MPVDLRIKLKEHYGEAMPEIDRFDLSKADKAPKPEDWPVVLQCKCGSYSFMVGAGDYETYIQCHDCGDYCMAHSG